MIGMRQRLKLSPARGRPFTERGFSIPSPRRDLCQKLRLRQECLGCQSSRFSCGTDGCEIHTCRKILLTGIGKQVGAWVMSIISPQSALVPLGSEELLRLQTVINGHQLAAFQ